jgi:hypothetical protein
LSDAQLHFLVVAGVAVVIAFVGMRLASLVAQTSLVIFRPQCASHLSFHYTGGNMEAAHKGEQQGWRVSRTRFGREGKEEAGAERTRGIGVTGSPLPATMGTKYWPCHLVIQPPLCAAVVRVQDQEEVSVTEAAKKSVSLSSSSTFFKRICSARRHLFLMTIMPIDSRADSTFSSTTPDCSHTA